MCLAQDEANRETKTSEQFELVLSFQCALYFLIVLFCRNKGGGDLLQITIKNNQGELKTKQIYITRNYKINNLKYIQY